MQNNKSVLARTEKDQVADELDGWIRSNQEPGFEALGSSALTHTSEMAPTALNILKCYFPALLRDTRWLMFDTSDTRTEVEVSN